MRVTQGKDRSQHEWDESEEVVEPKPLENSELGADIDDLLDDIDDVLEENAEEFVKGYVQTGGE